MTGPPRRSVLILLGAVAIVLCLTVTGPLSSLNGSPSSSVVSPSSSTPSSSLPATSRSSSAPVQVRGSVDAPAAAPALTLGGKSPAAVGLTWTDTATGTFTNYTVQEASQATHWRFLSIAVITAAGTTSYAASGVSPGTNYSWQVVEYYETCTLVFICTENTEASNAIVNETQPSVAFLNETSSAGSNATLSWTNNATYGSVISFHNYSMWQEVNGSALEPVPSFSLVGSNSANVTLLPDTSYTFLLKTADCLGACGTDNPVLSTTQSNPVTLGTFRALSVSVTAERTAVDFGEADFFTCTPSGGRSPFTYAWNFSTGSYVAGNASESVVLGALGTASVSCQVTDGVPASNSSAVDVTVNSAMTVLATSNRSSADVGQVIGFSCTVSGGTMPYALTWLYGDGGTDTEAINSYTYAQSGNYTPACSVTDGAGVTDAPSLPLAVSPELNVTAVASSVAAAPGTVLTFDADVANGSGSYTAYSWSFAGGPAVPGASVSHAFSVPGEATARVAVTDSNGETETGSVVVDVSYISAVVTPRVTTATTGSEVRFDASASGGAGGPYTYLWRFGDGTTATGSSVVHWYNSTGKDTPTLVVTDRLGASNSTTLPTISVSAPTTPLGWLTGWVVLAIAVVIGAVLALFVLGRRRSREATELEGATPWVPPTDPKRTIRGRKVCPACGATNLPIRTTCSHCGKPLPRGPA